MTASFQCIPWLASSWAFKMFVNFTQVILQLHIASDFRAWCAKISERFEQQLHSSNWQRLLSDHFNLILCSWISIIDFSFSIYFLVLLTTYLCTSALQLGQLLLSITPLICTLFLVLKRWVLLKKIRVAILEKAGFQNVNQKKMGVMSCKISGAFVTLKKIG